MRLENLAAEDPEPERMFAALADTNRQAAVRNDGISPGCFTAYVRLTGESGGRVHDAAHHPLSPSFALPAAMSAPMKELLDKQFGPGRYRLVQVATNRANASDEYHATQLREKPLVPDTHCNYGAFLKDIKKDLGGAERAYRKAIALNGRHANALGNLANLLWETGDNGEAAGLYELALEAEPNNENILSNQAAFLLGALNDRRGARSAVDRGLAKHPESARLHLLRATLNLGDGDTTAALGDFRRARELGADRTRVECGYAVALHASGAPVGECIGAYRVAIALDPENGGLKLNLAQLLFLNDDAAEANTHLQEAMRLGLDDPAMLEAQFYLLSHTSSDPAPVIRMSRSLLDRGARLDWDVSPNIEAVRRHAPRKAALLELARDAMAKSRDAGVLDEILAPWPL